VDQGQGYGTVLRSRQDRVSHCVFGERQEDYRRRENYKCAREDEAPLATLIILAKGLRDGNDELGQVVIDQRDAEEAVITK